MKENVSLNLDGVTNVQPYHSYYEQRNGSISRNIADYLEIPYIGKNGQDNSYIIPPKTIDRSNATSLNIRSREDFYGTTVEDLSHVGKSILHPSISDTTPHFYSSDFASAVSDLVLPGIVSFSKEELISLFAEGLVCNGRLKLPDKSDGHGQYSINGLRQLKRALHEIPDSDIQKMGIIFEENLKNPQTLSVGFAQLGRDVFSFIAEQKDDESEGRNRYLGAKVLVRKGSINELLTIPHLSHDQINAVHKSSAFYDAYSYFDPIASRLSFDCLRGTDRQGNKISGITDITGRLGGTCPALMQAALEMKSNPNISTVLAEVTLNYDPNEILPEEQNAVIYVDHPTLRISSKIYESY